MIFRYISISSTYSVQKVSVFFETILSLPKMLFAQEVQTAVPEDHVAGTLRNTSVINLTQWVRIFNEKQALAEPFMRQPTVSGLRGPKWNPHFWNLTQKEPSQVHPGYPGPFLCLVGTHQYQRTYNIWFRSLSLFFQFFSNFQFKFAFPVTVILSKKMMSLVVISVNMGTT